MGCSLFVHAMFRTVKYLKDLEAFKRGVLCVDGIAGGTSGGVDGGIMLVQLLKEWVPILLLLKA